MAAPVPAQEAQGLAEAAVEEIHGPADKASRSRESAFQERCNAQNFNGKTDLQPGEVTDPYLDVKDLAAGSEGRRAIK